MVVGDRALYRAVAVVLAVALVASAAGHWTAIRAAGPQHARAELRELRAREAELKALRLAAVDEWHAALGRWEAAGANGPGPARPQQWERHSVALQDVQTRVRDLEESLNP